MDFIDDVKVLNYIKEIEKRKTKGVHSIKPPDNNQQEEKKSKQEYGHAAEKRNIRTFNKMYCEKGKNKISDLRDDSNKLTTDQIMNLMSYKFKSNQKIVSIIRQQQQEREM